MMALASTPSGAQISPGPLSRAHAALEGTAKCFQCHGTQRGEPMGQRCLACHGEIAWQTERKLGLHGREGLGQCAKCHPDHAGTAFDLVDWGPGGPKAFEHDRTGWPLTGRHAETACRDCHKKEFQSGEVSRRIKRPLADRSWLGLVRECASCHEDTHQATVGTDCARCHDDRAWKPAPRFDHSASTYPLTGKHAKVPCDRCHRVADRVFLKAADGSLLSRYKPVPHAECSACHVDPHVGRLGASCSTCHVSESFQHIDRTKFDHDRTRYPLRGKHRPVACANCHASTDGGDRPPSARCEFCHREAHAGKATLAGAKTDCASCHGIDGFRPATFSVEDHARTAYPLAGRHRSVDCAKCHTKTSSGALAAELGTAGVLMRPAHQACRDCHADAHAGQLARRSDAGACEACHTVQAWKPSTFTVDQHASTRFPLAGRHAAAPCGDCHAASRRDLPALPPASEIGTARVALIPLSTACESCHFDAHRGRFSTGGPRPITGGCAVCHGADRFSPSTVQVQTHQDFAYPLEGGHRATPCFECHDELRRPPARIRLLRVDGAERPLAFVVAHDRCEACHKSPHGEQFVGRTAGATCQTCHDVASFRPATRFDHDRDSSFALGKAHRTVPCASCHPMRTGPDGVARAIYRPVARQCEACHRGSLEPGEPS